MVIEIQQKGINMLTNDLEKKVKDFWKLEGNKVKDIDNSSTKIYFIPEQERVHFVINEGKKSEMKSSFHISEVFDLKAD